MYNLKLLFFDECDQFPAGRHQIAPRHDGSGDSQLPRLLSEGAVHKADQQHLFGPMQAAEQRVDMGFAPPTSPPEMR